MQTAHMLTHILAASAVAISLAAWNVKGVKNVKDSIVVRTPSSS